jgi:hypothetical protein
MLYAGIQDAWSAGAMFHPLYRGNFMRAITTAGHSINFGYSMAMAFGIWLYVRRCVPTGASALGMAAIDAGLVVALARGPWIGAVVVLFVYLMSGPRPGVRLVQGMLVVGVCAAFVLLSPWRSHVIDFLPFVGTIDASTIAMRQQLAAGSWLLILQNPFFGSPYFLQYMEEFRTGEGIIDLVNTYATVALSYGMVGAGIFIAFFGSLVWKALREARRSAPVDPDHALLGACIAACVTGTLVIIATTSFQLALPSIAWSLAALATAYLRLSPQALPVASAWTMAAPAPISGFQSRIPAASRGRP